MKAVLFLLNDRSSVRRNNATTAMMLACHQLGHPVLVTDVFHLQAYSSTSLFAEARGLPTDNEIDSSQTLAQQMGMASESIVDLMDVEAVLIRTAPGKDDSHAWAHRLALEVMRLAHDNGVRIINDPIGLQRASSKLYTVCLPQHLVPRTMVCHSLASVKAFAEELNGPFVMKPLLGSQGRDVFFLDSFDSLNTRQLVDILGRTGYLVVQEYVPEAVDGDTRVLTVDDQLIGGKRPVGIRRIPAAGERRSNISLGGTAEVVELTQRQRAVCAEVANLICHDGIRFAGLDLVGEKIVEVNVFSPSGIQELDRKLERSVTMELMQSLLGSEGQEPS